MPNQKILVTSSLALFLVCVIASCSFGVNGLVAPDVQWQKSYGALEGNSVLQTPDGGFLVGGEVKTDSAGNVQWTKTWGIGVNSAIETKDGGYALLLGGNAIYKISSGGEIQWSTQIPFDADCILQSKDNGYIIAGATTIIYGGMFGQVTGQIYKLFSNGAVEWSKTYDGIGFIKTILTDSGYGFLVSKPVDFDNEGILFLVTTDFDGNVIFEKHTGISEFATDPPFLGITQTKDKGFLAIGYNGLAVKLDKNGAELWIYYYERPDLDNYVTFNSVVETSDGGCVILGTGTYSSGVCVVVKLSSSGAFVWEKTFEKTSKIEVGNIVLTSDGGFAFTQSINGVISLTKLATTEPTQSLTLTPSQTPSINPSQMTLLGVGLAVTIIAVIAVTVIVFFTKKKKAKANA